MLDPLQIKFSELSVFVSNGHFNHHHQPNGSSANSFLVKVDTWLPDNRVRIKATKIWQQRALDILTSWPKVWKQVENWCKHIWKDLDQVVSPRPWCLSDCCAWPALRGGSSWWYFQEVAKPWQGRLRSFPTGGVCNLQLPPERSWGGNSRGLPFSKAVQWLEQKKCDTLYTIPL